MRNYKKTITVYLISTICMLNLAHAAGNIPEKKDAMHTLGNDVNRFSLDLYARIAEEEGNIFFSPLSVTTAFALAQQGAAGETAAQMNSALRHSLPMHEVPEGYRQLMNSLNEREGEGVFQLHMANALWVQQNYGLKREYIEIAKKSFSAKVEELDFANQPGNSADRINSWVAGKTADKIQDLIPAAAIDDLTRLILTNAIYFLGTWESQFQKSSTRPREFHLLDNETIEIPTMHQSSRFRYTENENVQILEMPYKESGLTMMVILPREKGGLPAVEGMLDNDLLKKWTAAMKPREVQVALPKFKMETDYTLNAMMQGMGMRLAFTPRQADFSNITDKEDLYIQAAIHKAYVEVDEKGTEAAAATGIIIRATSAPLQPPANFIADHPFLFTIRDTRSGAVLFMGRVVKPNAK